MVCRMFLGWGHVSRPWSLYTYCAAGHYEDRDVYGMGSRESSVALAVPYLQCGLYHVIVRVLTPGTRESSVSLATPYLQFGLYHVIVRDTHTRGT